MDAIMFDNDARACYDRIIAALAAIFSRRAGVPREVAWMLITLLLHMRFFVRTAYGVASEAEKTMFEDTVEIPPDVLVKDGDKSHDRNSSSAWPAFTWWNGNL